MKKLLKKMVIMFFLTMFISNFNVLAVQAITHYTDKENNNSANEAQIITVNTMTYTQKVSVNTSLYSYVTGNLIGKDDEDWYMLHLTSNQDTYFTINGNTGTIFIDILDSNQNVLQTFSYNGLSNSENVFKVKVEENKLYYIRLYHNVNLTYSYNFTIGNPQYFLDSYTYKFGNQILPAKGKWEKQVDLTTISSIPKKAIAYEIAVGGCIPSVSSKRFFYNEFYHSWVSTKTGYKYNLPVTDSSKLAQVWGVKYESSNTSDKTFTPEFTISYVYPDLPQNEQ